MKLIARKDAEIDEEIYWAATECSNCGLKESLAFYKYQLMENHLCPHCECKTLITIRDN